VVRVAPIPLHSWRLPVMAAVVHWKRFRDWLDVH
jgi:hypothetical protein